MASNRPEGTTGISVSIPLDVRRAAAEVAAIEDSSLGAIVTEGLRLALEKRYSDPSWPDNVVKPKHDAAKAVIKAALEVTSD